MKLDALDHPKTFDFAARLGIDLPTALGHLELLWAFTGKKSPQGDIGKWPDGSIARACHWMGAPAAFMDALREAGFIDPDADHRLLIHDWPEHAPRWVRAKLKSLDKSFLQTTGDTTGSTTVGTKGDFSPDCRADSVREGKGSEEKRREAKRDSGAVQGTASPSDDATPIVLTFRTNGRPAEWHLRQSFVDELVGLYPSLDVLGECRKSHAKIESGAVSRKTAKGMKKFLFAWMDRGTNGRTAYGGRAQSGAPVGAGHRSDVDEFLAGGIP